MGRNLLCKKFQVYKAVDVDKTRALFHVHPQRYFFMRNALYGCTDQCRVSCKVFLQGRKPEKKWAVQEVSHLSRFPLLGGWWWQTVSKPRRTSKLVETIPKQFRWGLTMARGIATFFSLLGRLLLVSWTRTAATQIYHWPWQPEWKAMYVLLPWQPEWKAMYVLLGLLSGEMTTASLVDLAVLQSVCDVLMRTVQSVDPKRKPSSEATCLAKRTVPVSDTCTWHRSSRPCMHRRKKNLNTIKKKSPCSRGSFCGP